MLMSYHHRVWGYRIVESISHWQMTSRWIIRWLGRFQLQTENQTNISSSISLFPESCSLTIRDSNYSIVGAETVTCYISHYTWHGASWSVTCHKSKQVINMDSTKWLQTGETAKIIIPSWAGRECLFVLIQLTRLTGWLIASSPPVQSIKLNFANIFGRVM